MHEAALAQAALPAPSIILRLPMRPYSLGHELVLQQRGNPLIQPDLNELNQLDNEAKIAAIIQAADVCSMTWAGNRWKPGTWWQVFRLAMVCRKWNRKMRFADWGKEIGAWLEYRSAGMNCFEAELPRTSTTNVRYIGAPETLRLYQFILKHIPESEQAHYCPPPMTVWDFPYGLARMHYQCHAENEGGLEIYSLHNKIFDEYVKKREAEKAAAAKDKPDA